MIALRLELRVARGALRRLIARPTRRALWAAAAGLLLAAFAFDLVTSDVGSRELGRWAGPWWLVAVVPAAVLALAAAVGARTPRAYGTRPADAIWWRQAGIARADGERATAAISAARATLAIGSVAVPLGTAFALADSVGAGTILALAAGTTLLAPLVVLVGYASAARPGEVAVGAGAPATRAAEAPRRARPASRVPQGLLAARWLIARRRGERLVPLGPPLLGALAGVAVAWLAASVNGQLASTLLVIGPLAVLLDGALRHTSGPEPLRSPWWRAAVGSRAPGIAAWAIAQTLPAGSGYAGAVIALGIARGALLVGLVAAVPAVLVPPTQRLANLAVDVDFPLAADRRGAAAAARVALCVPVVALPAALAWSLAAAYGAIAALAAATAAIVVIDLLLLIWIAARFTRA